MPRVTILVATRNRPAMLRRAVRSALDQTVDDLEVVVVDDHSSPPAEVPDDPRVRLIRLPDRAGVAGARNAGLREARGDYVAVLDDDDELLPEMAEVSLAAVRDADLPEPVAALSGLRVVADGEAVDERLPPTLPRGARFFLEEIPPERSFWTKQTLVAPRAVLRELGGWDERFESRVDSELFLRLNAVCSIQGVPEVTHLRHEHGGDRLGTDPTLRQTSFRRLVAKHREVLRSRPRGCARFVLDHAITSLRFGQRRAALRWLARAVAVDPISPARRLVRALRRRI